MVECKDLTKGQTGSEHLQNLSSCGVFPGCPPGVSVHQRQSREWPTVTDEQRLTRVVRSNSRKS